MFDFNDGPFTGMTGPTALDEFPKVLGYNECGGDNCTISLPHEPYEHVGARSHLWNSPESRLMFGVDGESDPVTVDLASDTPHVIVSAGSGAGKSVIAASLATQALVKGATVAFLDVKRISHRWARNLPQVHYACEVDELANALVSIAAEVKRRMKVIEEFPGPISEADVGPRIVIIAEELNTMMDTIKDFEKTLPLRGVYKPLKAFADIMNLGRAAKVHVVAFAQYPDATIVPKRLMESFGYRVIIKHSNESWKMLAWQLGYCPPAPQQVGRGFVVMGDKAVQTQFLYITEEECAQLVRTAYDARVRMGLVPKVSRKQRRAQQRELLAVERGK